MVVLDTSMALSWCFEDEFTEQTQKTLQYIEEHGAIVPILWQLEVTNACGQPYEKKDSIWKNVSHISPCSTLFP